MKITKTTLPATSLLHQPGKKYDYTDSFQSMIIDRENKLQVNDICKAFLLSGPKWIDKLMNLRNKLVSLFGLKTSHPERKTDNLTCEPGDQVGIFNIFDKTDHEVILGEDDKHLDFRVSLFLTRENDIEKRLIISTTVVFRHFFGRLYFFMIKPFHKFIVPAMLKSIIASTHQL